MNTISQIEEIHIYPHENRIYPLYLNEKVLVINKNFKYGLGDEINNFGIEEKVKLNTRLLQILIILARKCIQGRDDGWVNTNEIIFLKNDETAQGLCRFMQKRIASPVSVRESAHSKLPGKYLIQYQAGKLSSGPYRIGVKKDGLFLDLKKCWDYHLSLCEKSFHDNKSILPVINEEESLENPQDFYESIVIMTKDAKYYQSEIAMFKYLKSLNLYGIKMTNYERGERFSLLANIESNLGASEKSLVYCEESLSSIKGTRSPRLAAQIYLVKANALYQLNKFEEARIAVTQALWNLDKCSQNIRKGVIRANYIGNRGVFYSAMGKFGLAKRDLETAMNITQDVGEHQWHLTWCIRSAESAIKQRDLALAEKMLSKIPYEQLHLLSKATFSRNISHFWLSTGNLQESEKWLNISDEIGKSNHLENHIRKLRYIKNRLQEKIR